MSNLPKLVLQTVLLTSWFNSIQGTNLELGDACDVDAECRNVGVCDETTKVCVKCTSDLRCLAVPITPDFAPAICNSDGVCEERGVSLCFSGRSMVQVEGTGSMRMDELNIGDKVLTGKGDFSEVYSFGHKQPLLETSFLQIHSNETKSPIEITKDHLIYLHDDSTLQTKVVPAGTVKVGDFLVTKQGASRVTSIHVVKSQGVFAPLTVAGSIIVNGVLASNYVTYPWLKDKVPAGMLHWLQHGSLVPYRNFCFMIGCHGETYNPSTGFSQVVQLWFDLQEPLRKSRVFFHTIMLSFLAIPALLVTLVGAAVDDMTTPSLVHTIVATPLVLGVFVWQRSSSSKLSSTVKTV